MTNLWLLCAFAFLASCVGSEEMTDAERDKAWGPSVATYILCSQENAAKVARRAGDPFSLAVAVSGMCQPERNKMWSAFEATNGAGFASGMVASIERDQIIRNAAIIVSARS